MPRDSQNKLSKKEQTKRSKKQEELSKKKKKIDNPDNDGNNGSDSENDEMDVHEYRKFLSKMMMTKKRLNLKRNYLKIIIKMKNLKRNGKLTPMKTKKF